MTQSSPSLTPAQHLRLLGRLAQPLLLILAHGLDQVGESLLSELTGQNIETCRHTLRELARYGYLEREEYHRGYRVLLAAYAVIPEAPPGVKSALAAASGRAGSEGAHLEPSPAQRVESKFLDSAQSQKTAFPRKTTRGKAAANRGISASIREIPRVSLMLLMLMLLMSSFLIY